MTHRFCIMYNFFNFMIKTLNSYIISVLSQGSKTVSSFYAWFQIFSMEGVGAGFCRFYTWFACLSTIYTNNLRKIYFYVKSLKSTIFVKKTFIFIMFNILPSNMVERSVNLKSVNHSCKKSFYEEYINVQPILRQISGRQIYNLSTLSVYNLHIFNAQKTV